MVNKKILGVAGLAAVALVGGTFAYFTQTDVIKNPFNTASHGSVVSESFDPSKGENWEPGVTVPKSVDVQNTGNAPILVKVAFVDKWTDSDGITERKTVNTGDVFGKTVDGIFHKTHQESPVDGAVDNDATVVEKKMNVNGWTQIGNAYYYNTPLAAGAPLNSILESVTLAQDLDLGKTKVEIYASEAETKPSMTKDAVTGKLTAWGDPKHTFTIGDETLPDGVTVDADGQVTVDRKDENFKNYKHIAIVKSVDASAKGYADAKYTLEITVTTVQATKEAAEDAFKHKAPEGESLTDAQNAENTAIQGWIDSITWPENGGNQEPEPDPELQS